MGWPVSGRGRTWPYLATLGAATVKYTRKLCNYISDAIVEFADTAVTFSARYYHADLRVCSSVTSETGVDMNLVFVVCVIRMIVNQWHDAPLNTNSIIRKRTALQCERLLRHEYVIEGFLQSIRLRFFFVFV